MIGLFVNEFTNKPTWAWLSALLAATLCGVTLAVAIVAFDRRTVNGDESHSGRRQQPLVSLVHQTADVHGRGTSVQAGGNVNITPSWIPVVAMVTVAAIAGAALLVSVQFYGIHNAEGGDQPHPTISGFASPETPVPVISQRVAVLSSQWRQPTDPKLVVTSGHIIHALNPTGQWECGDDTDMGFTGIGGYPKYVYNRDKYAVTDAPLCSLIARIGDNGRWVSFANGPIVADTSGTLYLTANELMPAKCDQPTGADSCYRDNQGSIAVTIQET